MVICGFLFSARSSASFSVKVGPGAWAARELAACDRRGPFCCDGAGCGVGFACGACVCAWALTQPRIAMAKGMDKRLLTRYSLPECVCRYGAPECTRLEPGKQLQPRKPVARR